MRSGGAFSDEEIQLLRGLPAVSNVTRDRITYSDTFRQVCTIRYLAGEFAYQDLPRSGSAAGIGWLQAYRAQCGAVEGCGHQVGERQRHHDRW